jgi:streptomycin 6-kinase
MVFISERLAAACRASVERSAWLEGLPEAIGQLQDRWELSLEQPFDGCEVSCSWVAPAVRRDGTRAVLKLGMPHMEGAHELQGLRFWNGDPTVCLLDADADLNAMLLESCEPGIALRHLPEPEQDLHAGNVLGSRREPWLVIDPKPFVGDRAYDATQHLLNCKGRMLTNLNGTIDRVADLLEIDHTRVRLWLFARSAAEPRDIWSNDSLALARLLA